MKKKMTNAEKFLKDGVNARKFSEKLADYILKDIYSYEGTEKEIDELIEEFLNINESPTLTADERVILRNIAKHRDFEKIGRRKIGGLYVTCRINIATEEQWEISFFDHLFQFIKERRRI